MEYSFFWISFKKFIVIKDNKEVIFQSNKLFIIIIIIIVYLFDHTCKSYVFNSVF